MTSGLHHLSKRKRQKFQSIFGYPSEKKWKKKLDNMLLIFAIAGPLFSLPQIIQIYSTQHAGDISTITWAAWSVMNLGWIFYGVVHKEKPIILAYTLWLVTNIMMVVGSILY
jgi:uncharacterized protein with PQ loop repeat